jgi:hypothetical protein
MELIGKQIAIETILGQPPELHYPSWYAAQIEKLPPAPPEYLAEQAGILVTDSDTISRQAAIDALDVLCQEHRYRIPGKRETYSQYNEAWQDALDRAEGAIGNLPSAQPDRKNGKWIDGYKRQTCSVCKQKGFRSWSFCPNCGADMRGEQDG